jgi:hypothetical protein
VDDLAEVFVARVRTEPMMYRQGLSFSEARIRWIDKAEIVSTT